MAKKQKKPDERASFRANIALNGLTAEDKLPEMAIYALDRSGDPLEINPIKEDGKFEISKMAMEKAHRIAVGPLVEDFGEMDRKKLTVYRPHQLKKMTAASGVLDIPKKAWQSWFMVKLCVNGSAKHCKWFPLVYSKYALEQSQAFSLAQKAEPTLQTQLLTDAVIAKPYESVLTKFSCKKICDGLVEVYRRTCCCYPWIIYDPRLPELIKELEELHRDPPIVKWPPRPEPDPLPFEEIPLFKGGALDKKVANAGRDLKALRTLPPSELPAYINARTYLFCNCNTPVKVADGFINPDGEFNICWWEWARIMRINCHDEYAFKIKQNIGDFTVTIYDGVAAGQWFRYGEHADLVSYHPQAIDCGEEEFPGEGAFALLQDIGQTGSWRLKTPDATGWDRVDTPVYNDGLAFPAINAAAAKGKYLDRNWGGLLKLRYFFSKKMKSIGAKYYRVSVVASNASGNPTGPRTYLSTNGWKYYEAVGSDVFVRKVALGPISVGGEHHLHEIPYHNDQEWLSGQYHAMLDTTKFSNGRFLLTLEVFNSTGKLVRPNGTTDPGGSVDAAFTYRRWYQETGPTAEVPYAALTHMLWWDNRKAKAKIEDFRVDGVINTGECQFLESNVFANFSVGYRAYHPEPMFMLDHRLWWRRGLGGPSGILTSPHPNPDNVGIPVSPPHQSGNAAFSTMLGTHLKCTFSINLHTNVKTFDGIQTLNGLDEWDQASVALAIGSGIAVGS
jgi:hypothetical protein